ncbi:TetR family transcriptional regulator [Agromyces sp. SYSU T00266]|uniref:TetR family transcriptional regulator n=1 Tax=Agromyces zhanjiangensis TaxID=3158562 RepID=UPI003391C87A
MRSVRPEDATTAARIRDAAIARFGAHGYAGTSLREVAADAGVSAALVIHHYGSKEGLRRACDDWLVHELMGEKDRLGGASVAATIREWLDDPARFRTSIAYFAAMLADESPGADRLFDLLLAETSAMLERGVGDGSIHGSSDPELRAVLITAYGLAPLLLRGQLARVLGAPLDSPAVVRRMTLPTLEFYTQGLYADTHLLDAAREAIDSASGAHAPESRREDPAPRVRSDKGPGNPVQDPDPPVGDSARA